MNKMKKVLASIMAIVALLSVCAVTSLAAMNVVETHKDYGNMYHSEITLKAAGGNTTICTLKKVDPDNTFSKFKVYNSSEIAKMYVWVANDDGEKVSEKYITYPDGNKTKIYYYKDITFRTDGDVVFIGEQYNVAKKNIEYKAYSY